ncbi:SIS domain-containing protein [Patescibacteria group bacterium]|nr:SIS domain-containing protein [Patescibacteria group bacterium]MCL5797721.1 SIS domain-containing protein [Patescibacteria group bacterium]
MTDILDDLNAIENLDKGQSSLSIDYLADQCQSGWEEAKKISLPMDYSQVKSVLFCGMGGSAYGARIIKSAFSDILKIPVDLVGDYHLPLYVDKEVLIITASYSGGTEETISCAKEAIRIGAKIIGISSGGALCQILKDAGKPFYAFNPKFNPSNQPRLGQGYMLMGQMGILRKLDILQTEDSEVKEVIKFLRSNTVKFSVNTPSDENIAKKKARLYQNRIINIIGGEFLEGAIHAIRNPFHETGKHFANYFVLPELNHHLMEGLSYPAGNKENLLFLFIDSDLYSDKIRKRVELTKEVVDKNDIPTDSIKLSSGTKIGQVFELIQLGSYTTFYLAMLHGINPVLIPWVDYFKKQLSAKG